jgi:hypothetical protein
VLATPLCYCGAIPARYFLIPNELTACFSPRISHSADFAAVPWGLFPSALPKDGADGQGWRHWRLNLYRYDYGSSERGCDLGSPADDGQSYSSRTARSHCKQEELSAWSSSGEGNFHLPQWFGSATLLDE